MDPRSRNVRSIIPHRFTEADGIPDITHQDMITLDEMWNLSLNGEMSPNKAFEHAFSQHYSALRPYMSKLESGHDDLYAYWRLIYNAFIAFKNASSDFDSLHRATADPAKLVWNEEQAKGRMLNAEASYKHAKEDFYSEIDWRNAELGFLYEITEKVKAATEFPVLLELVKQKESLDNAGEKARQVSRFTMDKTPEEQEAQPKRHATFFARLFNKLPCMQKDNEEIYAADPKKSAEQNQKRLEELKAKLVKEWEERYTQLQDEHNDLALKPLGNEYKKAYLDAVVQRLHHRIHATRRQGKDGMYHALRLYALSLRLYYRMYGANPVEDNPSREPIEPIRDRSTTSDIIIAKIQALFKQMVRGMRSNLYTFYCRQPSMVRFEDYLESFNDLSMKDERLKFLRGDVDEQILDRIFIEYETPEEAYAQRDTTRLGY